MRGIVPSKGTRRDQAEADAFARASLGGCVVPFWVKH